MKRIVLLLAILSLALIGSRALAAGGPSVGTGTAEEITDTTATVVGAVNPGGEATTYAFQYGTTTQYAGQTGVHSVGPPRTSETVTAILTGLLPGTTYHFRVIAANASGTAAGNDVTFKTGGLAPPLGVSPHALTEPATAIGSNGAVSGDA